MKVLRYIISFAAIMVLLTVSASADDFIFKYKSGVPMLMSADTEYEHVVDDFFAADDETMLQRMLDAGIIEYYEPNVEVILLDEANDTKYMDQSDYSFRLTNANGVVNNKIYNGDGVRVGIIDSGLADNHNDINYDNVVARCEVFGYTEDVHDYVGHGTSVAGLIAAVTDNGYGVSSLAPEAELVIVKAFPNPNPETGVTGKSTNLTALLKSLDYAINQDCDVINMSVGVKQSSTNDIALKSLEEMINRAEQKGIIVVAASGNHDSSNKNDITCDSPIMYPGGYENTICVGSIDSMGFVSDFSYHNASVDVVACGTSVDVLDFDESSATGTRTGSGTSFSTPYVTSIAALAKQIDPNITVSQFRELLYATAIDAGDEGYDHFYGAGIVNAGKLLDAMLGRDIIVGVVYKEDEWGECLSRIANNGFDTYEILDIWHMENGDGRHYNSSQQTITLEPRSYVDVRYQGWCSVYHMVWLRENLEPVCAKEIFENPIIAEVSN